MRDPVLSKTQQKKKRRRLPWIKILYQKEDHNKKQDFQGALRKRYENNHRKEEKATKFRKGGKGTRNPRRIKEKKRDVSISKKRVRKKR